MDSLKGLGEPLTIIGVEAVEIHSPFRATFEHAGARRTEARHLIVKVTTACGHVGYGEALPRAYLTGESLATCTADLHALWEPALKGLRIDAREPPFEALRPLYERAQRERKTASYAAVDIAVFDAWARAAGRPAALMFGAPPESRPLTGIIAFGMPAALVARLFVAAGCQDFKVKVGDAGDLRRVAAVRRAIGPKRSLRIDANGAWSFDAATEALRQLAPFGIDCVEEPLTSKNSGEMAQLQRDSGIAVMADESLCTEDDARALLAADAARFWNVRLAKVGGFYGARSLFAMAAEAGIRCQLGALVGESRILTAAADAALGLGSPMWTEAACSGLLLKSDPFRASRGVWLPAYRCRAKPQSTVPGLGVEMREMGGHLTY